MKKIKSSWLCVLMVLCMVTLFVIPAYAVESFEVCSAIALDSRTLEVQFNTDVDQTLAVDVGNYLVREAYEGQIIIPVASASMKVDGNGNIVANTVVLKFGNPLNSYTLYKVSISGVTAYDGTSLAPDRNYYNFVGNGTNTPEDQDVAIENSAVGYFTISGNTTVTASWYAFDTYMVEQTGATGYEIYYIKKADLGMVALTKDTIGASKVIVNNISTSYVQFNVDGNSWDYAYAIYAVNGRTYSQPSYAPDPGVEVASVCPIDSRTIEVEFNVDIDQTFAVNANNYIVRQKYGSQTVAPVVSASMKLDGSGSTVGNIVVLKLGSGTILNTLYEVVVSNIIGLDGMPLSQGRDRWTFVPSSLNTPEDQDAMLQTSTISEFMVSGSETVEATWGVLSFNVTGYEIYYMKKVDLGSEPLTKDTIQAVKVAIDGASTSSTQINIDGNADDYKFVIYAVNGRTYSMPSYTVAYLFGIRSATAVNSKTIEVQFSENVDQTLATDTWNYFVAQRYGIPYSIPITSASMKTDADGNIIGDTVILKLANDTSANILYFVSIANITGFDGTPLASDKTSCTFVGSGLHVP